MSNHRGKISCIGLMACGFLAAMLPMRALACGPFFPEEVITAGDQRILDLPVGDFTAEMNRLLPAGQSTPKAVQSLPGLEKPSVYELSDKVDESDLRAALKAAGADKNRINAIASGYTQARSALAAYAQAIADAKEKGATASQPPKFVAPVIPDGLPPEFNDYLRGLVAFHAGDLPAARAAWTGLLNRPEDQRRLHSTWAAFMLGKSYLTENPPKAREWFVKTRKLTEAGFSDSLGLAASSLGWEAKTALAEGKFTLAMDLYLKQLKSGDSTAAMSLRQSAKAVFAAGADALATAARDDLACRVITAYILCDAGPFRSLSDQEKPLIPRWLAAVETAAPLDMPGADRLAWAAYRSGDFISAGKWAKRAGTDDPMAQWVRAKLLLRDGETKAAAQMLAQLVKSFPADDQWLSDESVDNGQDAFHVTTDGKSPTIIPAVVSNLAVLKLSRGQYVEAMDYLLRDDLWMDAAYIAERVLSADEIKTYVDAHFPASSLKPELHVSDGNDGSMCREDQTRMPRLIRHLLARRLARLGRWKEARDYYPADVRTIFDDYIAAIRSGNNKKLSDSERATAFMKAARLAHDNGMEMLGTELDPDFFCFGGNFGGDSTNTFPIGDRKKLTAPSDDELARYKANAPDDPRRFHYRYTAAEHAWSAAQLMPDDTDETAVVLNEAGCWLKDRNPKFADRFYKALVRRCPSTALGKAAAAQHWFPAKPKASP